jgi:hypothetical protein
MIEQLRTQVFNLAMKLKYEGRATRARLLAIEARLGIPAPPKFAKREAPADTTPDQTRRQS